MQKKLFLSYFTVILIAIGISLIAFWDKGYQFMNSQSQAYYLTQAKLIADIFSQEKFTDVKEFDTFAGEYSKKYDVRITIVDRNGQVYAESSTNEPLENHATREEIVKALQGESVTVDRYSKTMGQRYSYSAVPVTNGDFSGVLRVSVPMSELKALSYGVVNSIFYAVIICFILAIITAFLFMELLSKPLIEVTKAAERISQGEFGIKIYTRERNQIGRLAAAFNTMAGNLKDSIDSLTRRNAELEAMLSSMTAGVVAVDYSNEVLLFNKVFYHYIKSQEKDIKGQSLYSLMRNAAVFDAIEYVKNNNTSVIKEGYLFGTGNQSIRVTAAPLGREGDAQFGVLLIIEDITQIKKLETMRSDFVSNVTHELKTPLTSIRGFIDTLKNGAIKDEAVANKFLDIIDIEAERLHNLIQDILLLSEIESKRDYEAVDYDMSQCAKEVMELLEPKLPPKVKFVFQPELSLRPFQCNPDRMKQLFINLLDNAVKYTEEGTISLSLREESNWLVMNIKDTGIGMEKEHLSRIFERFYRVDKGRSRKQGGTGLGLSIVKHIVELYNGTIRVDSEPGVGTEFEIRLPFTHAVS